MKINEIITENKNFSIDTVYQSMVEQRSLLIFLKQAVKRYQMLVDGALDVNAVELFNRGNNTLQNYDRKINDTIKKVNSSKKIKNKQEWIDKINKLRL
jgi:hypothetical protein